MIDWLIEWSIKNRVMVLIAYLAIAAAGYWALTRTPIDAIPDLSDNQVIVFTDWAGRSMDRVESTIVDYEPVFAPIRERRIDMSGQQLGDPAQAGRALLTLVEAEKPPTHLILGSDALRLVADSRASFDAETAAWSELSKSTDYPDGEQIA